MSISSFFNFRRTIDDRGQSIECRSLRAIQRQASRDPGLVAVIDRITAEVVTHVSMWQVTLISLASGALFFVSRMLFGSQPFFLELAPMLILMSIAGIEMARNHYRKMIPGVTRILIEEGICAGCAYPLEGLSENSDGMLVCPECSASWLYSRILRFTPIAKHATTRTVRGDLRHWVTQVRRGTDRRGIRDDRDSPRAVIALRTARKVREALTGDHRTRLDAAVKILRPMGRARRFLNAGFNVILAAGMLSPILLMGFFGSRIPLMLLAPISIFSTLMLILTALTIFSDLGRPSKLVRTEFLRQDLCPCCAADLQGLAQDHDRCTVCPECGAAWKQGDPD